MAQDYTVDVFAGGHVAQVDLQNIENNFIALRSSFSGLTEPSNPTAGMWWLDTTTHIIKVRNEANSAWESVYDLANSRVINALNCSRSVVAGTGLSGGGTLTGDVTLNVSGVDQAAIVNDAVGQGELKTTFGEATIAVGAACIYNGTQYNSGNVIAPGGSYGFWPRSKITYSGGVGCHSPRGTIAGAGSSFTHTSYATYFYLQVSGSGNGSGSGTMTVTCYAQQYYVQSSGEVPWIYILRHLQSKEIIATWYCPDHPCFGNGAQPELTPHPFPNVTYDEETGISEIITTEVKQLEGGCSGLVVVDRKEVEILVINPDSETMEEISTIRKSNFNMGFLGIISEHYDIDDLIEPDWPNIPVTVDPSPRCAKGQTEKPKPIKKIILKPEMVRTAAIKRKTNH